MRSSKNRKPVLFYAAGAGLIVAIGFLCFELGRYSADYSMFDEGREVAARDALIRERDATIEELLRQLAILETSGDVDRETYKAVEANLGELQARIQAQEEELVFYRGIVSPGDGVAGLRIQNIEVEPENMEQRHRLRLLLVQAIVHNERVTGTVRVKIRGGLGDGLAELELEELVGEGEAAEIPYGFRYFQRIEQALIFPVGFVPEQLEIEILPSVPRGSAQTQTFSWAAVSG